MTETRVTVADTQAEALLRASNVEGWSSSTDSKGALEAGNYIMELAAKIKAQRLATGIYA